MPDLLQSLRKQDVGYIRIVAELWGIDFGRADSAVEELCASLLDPNLLTETLEILPADSISALGELAAKNGRIPWAEFTRRFGEVREMGSGRREREQPHRAPVSAAESLYYWAFLARAFFETEQGPQEFAYIPDDLLNLIKQSGLIKGDGRALTLLGRSASPREKKYIIPATDHILDDATTFLAAMRLGIESPNTKVPVEVLEGCLRAAKILQGKELRSQAVKSFLELSREEALKTIGAAWRGSENFNELQHLPGLCFEGQWTMQPESVRTFLLDLLEMIPKDQWWSLVSFVADLKSHYPDFLRPSGDYDSWFIKRESDGQYLRGFEHWDQVDGALIRFLITGPMHWLGQVDLAAPQEDQEPTAFLLRSSVAITEHRNEKIHVSSQGKISIPLAVARAVRYQVSRFCEWDAGRPAEFHYRITPRSLERAAHQGLRVEQLLPLLAKNASAGVSSSLVKALKRWEMNGTEARLRKQVVLRVSKPEVLDALRESKAKRFLGEALGPTAVIVKEGAQSRVLTAMAELGYLAEEED